MLWVIKNPFVGQFHTVEEGGAQRSSGMDDRGGILPAAATLCKVFGIYSHQMVESHSSFFYLLRSRAIHKNSAMRTTLLIYYDSTHPEQLRFCYHTPPLPKPNS